ncbi:hypothetical protein PACTADRAFT_75565 [Pachysolen tannophilus NRRL Y-2460]|uniref:Major facilitator superfamily (MFS) profile domain-containing protein n=1 Tax=Pachysolen tannophilus NRRL Y-2460 TaxID=669874 RepID=A0A1E4TXF4_PACTA|nr:hypothetical protein PACTADRAFT_75565 [Pachysolen tannophilus NRRL Y-2460]
MLSIRDSGEESRQTGPDLDSETKEPVEVGKQEGITYDPRKEASYSFAKEMSSIEVLEGKDPNEVRFDGRDDPADPKNMSFVRKWIITLIVSFTALCITMISSCWSMATDHVMEFFHIGREVSILGISLYIFGLGLGPTFLSPISEYHGRRLTYVGGLFCVVCFQLIASFCDNIGGVLFSRFMTGFSGSAFMSVSSGTISDMFDKSQIGTAMVVYSIMPFLGPSLGPLISAAINSSIYFRWTFHVMLIFSGAMLVAIILFVPETYVPVLIKRKAIKLRKETGNQMLYAPLERTPLTLFQSTILSSKRPLLLLIKDPMMLSLCFYSGLILAIVYMFFVSFPYIFSEVYGFGIMGQGLSFMGLIVGILLLLPSAPLLQKLYEVQIERNNGKHEPEFRLPAVMLGSIFIAIGLFILAWTAFSKCFWIGPLIGSACYGLGTALIFTGIFTYTVDAYRLFAASGMAANSLIRSAMAGVFPLFTLQMYEKLGIHWATTLLAFCATALIPMPFIFYKYGAYLRSRSPFGWTDVN